jgi:hypothetical protein
VESESEAFPFPMHLSGFASVFIHYASRWLKRELAVWLAAGWSFSNSSSMSSSTSLPQPKHRILSSCITNLFPTTTHDELVCGVIIY